MNTLDSGKRIAWSFRTPQGLTLRGQRTAQGGDRPVLMFIHGNGFCGGVYWPLMARCLDQVDWLWVDVPGHGDSDAGEHFLGWNENAEMAYLALRSQLPHYDGRPCYLVGHSFGGVMSLLIAARHPEFVPAAVILDPVLFTPAMLASMRILSPVGLWQRNAMAQRARKRRAHWPDRRAAWTYFHGRGMFGSWSDEALSAYIDDALAHTHGGLTLKCPPQREAEIFGSYPRQLWASVRRLSVNMHIVYGRESYPFVPKSARKAARAGQQITAEAVGGSHFFMLEHPDDTAQVLKRWLGSLR